MTPAETTALLALWQRCPECRPSTLFVAGYNNGDAKLICVVIASDGRKVLIPDYSPDAISALACDAIERWMLDRHGPFQIQTYRDGFRFCSITTYSPHNIATAIYADKLSALIAATNAVLDAEGTQ